MVINTSAAYCAVHHSDDCDEDEVTAPVNCTVPVGPQIAPPSWRWGGPEWPLASGPPSSAVLTDPACPSSEAV